MTRPSKKDLSKLTTSKDGVPINFAPTDCPLRAYTKLIPATIRGVSVHFTALRDESIFVSEIKKRMSAKVKKGEPFFMRIGKGDIEIHNIYVNDTLAWAKG